jgi:signal recognition particle subunit SRP54
MVLADLGSRLHGALNQLSRASVVDDKVGPHSSFAIVPS